VERPTTTMQFYIVEEDAVEAAVFGCCGAYFEAHFA
jgi:hypothetical protein